jgi:hypothetical protein
VAGAGAAPIPALVVGKPFTLASPPPGGPGISPVGVEASGLGSDGTVWSAIYGTASEAVVVVARAADGRTFGPVDLTVPGGLRTGAPVISVSGPTATFAWLAYDSKYHTEVEARTCTMSGCRPTQTVAIWQAIRFAAPVFEGGSAVGIASESGRTVLVFYRNTGTAQMMWAQASDGRFGPVRAIAAPRLNSNTAIDIPVVIAESGGRVLALWPRYGPNGLVAIGWSIWTGAAGFGAASTIAGAEGHDSDDNLVATAVGGGAAVAWIQGDNVTDPGQEAEPIWLARQHGPGFSNPVRVFAGDAGGLSLAAGDGVLALAFTTAQAGTDVDEDGPAMITRSIDGSAFGTPAELAPSAAPFPTVTVDSNGNTIATYDRETRTPQGPTSAAQVAIAAPHGSFQPPIALGAASHNDLIGDQPAIHTSGSRSAIVWVAATGSASGILTSP